MEQNITTLSGINERQARAYECSEEEYLEQSGLMANWIAILQCV